MNPKRIKLNCACPIKDREKYVEKVALPLKHIVSSKKVKKSWSPQ